MLNLRRFVMQMWAVFLGFSLAGPLIQAQNEGAAEGEQPEAGVTESAEPEAAEPLTWTTFTSEEHEVSFDIPGGTWEKKTSDEIGSQSPGGCIAGGQLPPGLIVVIQNEARTAGASVSRIQQEFLFKTLEDLKTYAARQRNRLEEHAGEGLTIRDSNVERQSDSMFKHRLAFTAPISRGGPGCRMQAEGEEAQDYRHVLVDYFVRPAGRENVRLYQIVVSAEEDVFGDVEPVMDRLVDSFTFEADTAGAFFVPDAEASNIPEPGTGTSRQTPWALYLLLMVMFLYFYWRWRRRKANSNGTSA